jgi:hypothetical protein
LGLRSPWLGVRNGVRGGYVHTITTSGLLERERLRGGGCWEFCSCDLVSEVSRPPVAMVSHAAVPSGGGERVEWSLRPSIVAGNIFRASQLPNGGRRHKTDAYVAVHLTMLLIIIIDIRITPWLQSASNDRRLSAKLVPIFCG